MYKKLKSIFICGLLLLTIIPTLITTNKTYLNNESFNDVKNEGIFQTVLFPDFPVMENFELIFETIEKSSSIVPLDDLPKEFSWTNYNGKDWTTPAKHQGPCGSCWAFAALGVFESMIKIREKNADLNPDLSEQYILSCLPSSGSCYGGNAFKALQNIKETTPEGNYHNGVIPESCMKYEADDDIPCSYKCENWVELLVPLLDYGYVKSNDSTNYRDVIKTQILQNGPVVTAMKATQFFKIYGALVHNPNAYYQNFRPTLGLNHVVMIVGWKDIPLIPSGGYWICKNSWGQDWGYNGFFNIAYGSLNIDKLSVIWADYDPESYNWKPYAETGGPYGAFVGQPVYFDASKSIGYEGEIIDFTWDFGDGEFGSGITTSHVYNETGIFTLTLNVTDDKNNKANATSKVWVQETNSGPITPIINGSSSGEFWKKCEYKIYSEDPDGNDLLYFIDWGDGKVQEWIGPFSSKEELTVTHTFTSIGNFEVKVKAKDPFNEESPWATLKVKMPRNKVFSFALIYFVLDLFKIWFKN